jgi:hypothetical protein
MTMTISKSSIPSHEIDASKNQFQCGIDFSQGIDSVESMPEVVFLKLMDTGSLFLGIGSSGGIVSAEESLAGIDSSCMKISK